MAGYEVRGWEVVMAEVSPALLARLAGRVARRRRRSATAASPSSCRSRRAPKPSSPSWPRPAPSLVSVNPLHTTLEEIFVQQVARTRSAREGALCMNLRTLGRIARAVFRESVRDRVLYNLVGFALLVIGASFLIGQLTAGQDVKIIKDLGLAAMAVFGLFIAIFIGIGLVSKEVERRSIYSLIAKPVRRSELVVGKYLGLVLTIVINVAVMTAVWYGVLGYMSWMGGRGVPAGAGRRRPSIRACSWRCT